MSFLKDLADVYDNNAGLIGKEEVKSGKFEKYYCLLPIFHKKQAAHVSVTISEEGEFLFADIIEEHSSTTIPITIKSMSRSSGANPHSIHDKIQYLDPNYKDYETPSRAKETSHFDEYLDCLNGWRESEHHHPFLDSLYNYLSKNSLIADIIGEGIFILNDEGRFKEKWEGKKEDKPKIMKVTSGGQRSTLVRFRMISADGEIYEPWGDKEIWDKHIAYQYESIEDSGLCYASGKITKTISVHPSYTRYPSDMAKIISKPTNKNFITYQGRFDKPEDAVLIGALVSLKAHNALKWLLERQGFKVGNSSYLVFGNKVVIPDNLLADLNSLFLDDDDKETIYDINKTEMMLSQKLSSLSRGQKEQLPNIGKSVTILCLDNATEGQGRIALTEYKKLDTKEYFHKLKKWQDTASWPHRYRGKNYIGSPTVDTIVKAAYGERVKDNHYQVTTRRLISCILKQQKIPTDIIASLVQQSIKTYKKDEMDQKRRAIDVTCSMLKHNKGGELQMALDTECTNRSYLFGRLLAIAEYVETSATEGSRETNAERTMRTMYHSPANTWINLHFKLQPYFRKNTKHKNMQMIGKRMITEIIDTLEDDFNNKPLKPEFLAGYSCQMRDFYRSRKQQKENGDDFNHDNTKQN